MTGQEALALLWYAVVMGVCIGAGIVAMVGTVGFFLFAVLWVARNTVLGRAVGHFLDE